MRYTQLNDWLHWQESLHRSEIELGLERVKAVAQRMQLLKPGARVVTVAGTNGKGSCVRMLEALCSDQGIKVGAFTSPHFHRYNERIRVDGREVEDRLICESFERIDQARGDISLTYFEFGTLAAIDIFQHQQVDVMLLEVGLGGRLDAVNIIDADVAVVTSIALDHQDWLGSDINVIGREKAGIYRAGRWAICADEQAPATVEDYAREIGAYWVAMGLSLNVVEEPGGLWSWQGVDADGELLEVAALPPSSLPRPSVAAALQAFVLLGYPPPANLADWLADVRLQGRAQRLELRGVEYLLDVAHNPAAAEMLAERLAAEPVAGETRCLVAMMADKDRLGVLQALTPYVQHWHLAALPGNSRAASVEQLQADLKLLEVVGQAHGSVEEALAELGPLLQAGDRVVIMGSFFTVAEALSILEPQVSA